MKVEAFCTTLLINHLQPWEYSVPNRKTPGNPEMQLFPQVIRAHLIQKIAHVSRFYGGVITTWSWLHPATYCDITMIEPPVRDRVR